MKIETLAGGESPDYAIFQKWMGEVSRLCDEYWICDNFYPFGDGELAAVSVLCSAAARSGYTAIAESKIKRPGVQSGACRLDLWFNWNGVARSFEFKHWRNSHWGVEDLNATLDYALAGARTIPLDAGHQRYGGVVAPIGNAALPEIRQLAAKCEIAFELLDPMPSTFIIFREVA